MAQVALGRLYSQGGELPIDPAKALKWYRAAALPRGTVEDGAELAEADAYIAQYGHSEGN